MDIFCEIINLWWINLNYIIERNKTKLESSFTTIANLALTKKKLGLVFVGKPRSQTTILEIFTSKKITSI
jgi:hypothetical protein